jgi:hypothetical protein
LVSLFDEHASKDIVKIENLTNDKDGLCDVSH